MLTHRYSKQLTISKCYILLLSGVCSPSHSFLQKIHNNFFASAATGCWPCTRLCTMWSQSLNSVSNIKGSILSHEVQCVQGEQQGAQYATLKPPRLHIHVHLSFFVCIWWWICARSPKRVFRKPDWWSCLGQLPFWCPPASEPSSSHSEKQSKHSAVEAEFLQTTWVDDQLPIIASLPSTHA